jgi:hypothetical protein
MSSSFVWRSVTVNGFARTSYQSAERNIGFEVSSLQTLYSRILETQRGNGAIEKVDLPVRDAEMGL